MRCRPTADNGATKLLSQVLSNENKFPIKRKIRTPSNMMHFQTGLKCSTHFLAKQAQKHRHACTRHACACTHARAHTHKHGGDCHLDCFATQSRCQKSHRYFSTSIGAVNKRTDDSPCRLEQSEIVPAHKNHDLQKMPSITSSLLDTVMFHCHVIACDVIYDIVYL